MRRTAIIAGAAALVAGVSGAEAKPRSDCQTHDCLVRTCVSRTCHARVAAKVRARRPKPAMRTTRASWYGPGLYGNPLGCAGKSLPSSAKLQPGTLGVAHKGYGCGTRVRICVRRCATVAVVDRGPYANDAEFDLTAATAQAVGFSGVGAIRVAVVGGE